MKKISHQAGSAALITPRRRVRVLSAFLAGIAGAGSSTALAQVYKWTDEGGGFHYSSAPPEKSQQKAMRLDSKALEVSRAKTPPRDRNKPPENDAASELAAKVQTLEQQLDAERQAREAADAQNRATQAALGQAQADQSAARNVNYIPALPEGVNFLYTPYPRHHRNDCAPGSACSHPEHHDRDVLRKTH